METWLNGTVPSNVLLGTYAYKLPHILFSGNHLLAKSLSNVADLRQVLTGFMDSKKSGFTTRTLRSW